MRRASTSRDARRRRRRSDERRRLFSFDDTGNARSKRSCCCCCSFTALAGGRAGLRASTLVNPVRPRTAALTAEDCRALPTPAPLVFKRTRRRTGSPFHARVFFSIRPNYASVTAREKSILETTTYVSFGRETSSRRRRLGHQRLVGKYVQ